MPVIRNSALPLVLLALLIGPMRPAAAFSHETPLISAVRAGDMTLVKKLIAAHVNLDDRDEYSQRTALMAAAETGSAPLAKLLIESGADPSLKDEDGETALDIARKQGNSFIAALIQRSIASRSPSRTYRVPRKQVARR